MMLTIIIGVCFEKPLKLTYSLAVNAFTLTFVTCKITIVHKYLSQGSNCNTIFHSAVSLTKKSIASSKASFPQNAIFHIRVSSRFLMWLSNCLRLPSCLLVPSIFPSVFLLITRFGRQLVRIVSSRFFNVIKQLLTSSYLSSRPVSLSFRLSFNNTFWKTARTHSILAFL